MGQYCDFLHLAGWNSVFWCRWIISLLGFVFWSGIGILLLMRKKKCMYLQRKVELKLGDTKSFAIILYNSISYYSPPIVISENEWAFTAACRGHISTSFSWSHASATCSFLILLGIGKIRVVNGILVRKEGFHPSLIWNLPLLWLKAFYSHVIAICITEKNPRNEGPHEATQWQQ